MLIWTRQLVEWTHMHSHPQLIFISTNNEQKPHWTHYTHTHTQKKKTTKNAQERYFSHAIPRNNFTIQIAARDITFFRLFCSLVSGIHHSYRIQRKITHNAYTRYKIPLSRWALRNFIRSIKCYNIHLNRPKRVFERVIAAKLWLRTVFKDLWYLRQYQRQAKMEKQTCKVSQSLLWLQNVYVEVLHYPKRLL